MKWYLWCLLIQNRRGVTSRCSDGGVGRCLAPYLFNPCKLIDKYQNLLLYCYANTGLDMSTLCTLVWIKLVMIILKWIWVLCVLWYESISYDNVWMDMSTLCALLCIELVMILLEKI